jgi:branched-chain amino acid transport system permease protein
MWMVGRIGAGRDSVCAKQEELSSVTLILQELVYGLSLGAIYALIALGYTMVYGIIQLINFAHGDVVMVGSFISVVVLQILGDTVALSGWSLVLTMLGVGAVCMVFCGLLGVVIERVAYRPLRNAPRLAPLISAIGASLILENAALVRFGNNAVPVPPIFPTVFYCANTSGVSVGDCHPNGSGVSVNALNLLIIAISILLMLGLLILVQRTKIGRAMRTVAQDREAASLMGVDVDRTIVITFFIGAALAGAAGFIYSVNYESTNFFIGFQLGLIAFTAAVLGGIGNIPGAMAGGVLIGLIQAAVSTVDNFVPGYQLQRWSEAIVFAVLILILVFKPSGLFGQQVPEKV